MSTYEKLFTQNQEYFQHITNAINQAKQSVDVEIYILQDDATGKQIYQALKQAAQRGISVRLLVDGIGSMDWLKKRDLSLPQTLQIRVFHPIPFSQYSNRKPFRWQHLYEDISKLNRRTHKKVVIVDQDMAFSGSHNFWDNSLYWHELGLQIAPCPPTIIQAFEYAWSRSKSITQEKKKRKKFQLKATTENDNVVIFNFRRKQRQNHIKNLRQRILQARQQVWIMAPYFVPPMKWITALCQAATSGCDVRLILPAKIDFPFMRLMARYYFPVLLNSGVKIYEFKPQVLHSKAMMIDDWSLLGSVNLNHRSFLYDLEIMISPESKQVQNQLKTEFERMFLKSRYLSKPSDYHPRWWERILGRALLVLRNWV